MKEVFGDVIRKTEEQKKILVRIQEGLEQWGTYNLEQKHKFIDSLPSNIAILPDADANAVITEIVHSGIYGKTELKKKVKQAKEALDLGIVESEAPLKEKPSKKQFNPRPYSLNILNEYSLKYDKFKRFWIYDKEAGIWRLDAELILNSILRKNILGTKDYKRYCVEEIIADLKGLTFTSEEPREPKPHLVPFNNGIYDLEKEKLIEFSPDYFFINKLPVNINKENRECETIDNIFSEIVDPSDMITLYEIIAYSLWRAYPYPKLFILYGSGGNGKTTFIKILNRILGKENISLVNSNDIQNNRFASSGLFGKLVNVSGEMDYTILKKTNRLKQTCGEDLIYCERKFKEPFPFVNYAKMIFLTNQVPLTMDKTFAFYRRIFLLEFPNKFILGENADPLIVEKIPQKEFEGLAWRCLTTLKELYKNAFVFTNHQKTEEITKKYEDLSNPLNKFLEEYTEKEPNSDIPVSEFSEKYITYLKQNGFRIWTNREINKVMREKGYKDKTLRTLKDDMTPTTYRAWLELKWK